MSILTAQAAPERNARTFKGSAPGVKHNTPALGRRGRTLTTNAETLEHCERALKTNAEALARSGRVLTTNAETWERSGRVLTTNAEALERCASAHHSVYCH